VVVTISVEYSFGSTYKRKEFSEILIIQDEVKTVVAASWGGFPVKVVKFPVKYK
jgi:hypothetical protein